MQQGGWWYVTLTTDWLVVHSDIWLRFNFSDSPNTRDTHRINAYSMAWVKRLNTDTMEFVNKGRTNKINVFKVDDDRHNAVVLYEWRTQPSWMLRFILPISTSASAYIILPTPRTHAPQGKRRFTSY